MLPQKVCLTFLPSSMPRTDSRQSCQDCIVEWIGTCEDQNKTASCPSCGKGPIRLADLRSVQRRHKRVNPITSAYSAGRDQNSKSSNETPITLGKVDLVTSTKLRAMLRQLEEMRQQDPKAKALVFSQFTSFLGERLTRGLHR